MLHLIICRLVYATGASNTPRYIYLYTTSNHAVGDELNRHWQCHSRFRHRLVLELTLNAGNFSYDSFSSRTVLSLGGNQLEQIRIDATIHIGLIWSRTESNPVLQIVFHGLTQRNNRITGYRTDGQTTGRCQCPGWKFIKSTCFAITLSTWRISLAKTDCGCLSAALIF